MDESVEPVVPLFVHQAALTSLDVAHRDEDVSLVPVLGVWADLSPMLAAGTIDEVRENERMMPVLVITDSVLDPTNPAIVNLVVSAARNAPADLPDRAADSGTDDGVTVTAFGPHWSVRVPTSWVGLLTAIMGTPVQVRMVLIDGMPPAVPEHAVVTLPQCAAIILPTPAGVHDTLTEAMGAEWASPVATVSDHHLHGAPPPNVMREQLWAITSGIALGQEHALNRAETFAQWVAVLAAGDAEDRAKHDALVEAAAWAYESAMCEAVPRAPDGSVAWPPTMTPLVAKVAELTDETAFTSYEDGLFFEDAVDVFGMESALMALCVNLAAKAAWVAAEPSDPGSMSTALSSSYLLGMWMDPASDDPWWATRATHALLLHHDTEVLVDLLTCNPSDVSRNEPHGPLTFRYLHVVTEALASLDLDPSGLVGLLGRLDVIPPRFNDMVHVATRLLGACTEEVGPGDEQCPGCVAVNVLVAETSDQQRLIAAAAGLLPLLADLDAQQAALPVGDEEWRDHRAAFLMHWLDHTAFVLVPQD